MGEKERSPAWDQGFWGGAFHPCKLGCKVLNVDMCFWGDVSHSYQSQSVSSLKHNNKYRPIYLFLGNYGPEGLSYFPKDTQLTSSEA